MRLVVEKASFVEGFLDANAKTSLEVGVEEGKTVIYHAAFSQPKILDFGAVP